MKIKDQIKLLAERFEAYEKFARDNSRNPSFETNARIHFHGQADAFKLCFRDLKRLSEAKT